MFKGSLVALITPFRDGAVDEKAFQSHVAWQLDQGTHGLVPIGTTGECPALEDAEQERLIAITVEVAKGRAPVIPGTGFNSTAHTIHATRVAKEAGADAALVVCPYYNKPTQEGLYQHFKAVHDALFAETSPAPVKYAASLLSRCTAEVRQPLWQTTPETQEKVQRAMRSAGLIN